MNSDLKQTIKNLHEIIFLNPISKVRGKIVLKNHSFSIISNNCWGGMVYKDYGLEYSSPTVGAYFFAEEYIKFLKNLKKYLELKVEFIKVTDSKYYKYMLENGLITDAPIGLIGDVEIVFLHYKSEKEASIKWERRKKRINWDNLIVKFNDQNLCTEELILEFDKLPFKNKLCFTSRAYDNVSSVIVFDEFKGDSFVKNDTKKRIYMKYINTTNYLNKIIK